jgi:hypothetical protein
LATLATQFSEALSNIEPDEDVTNAVTAHQAVSKALEDDGRLKALGRRPDPHRLLQTTRLDHADQGRRRLRPAREG